MAVISETERLRKATIETIPADRQGGKGVFDSSITTLRKLNDLGYGTDPGSGVAGGCSC